MQVKEVIKMSYIESGIKGVDALLAGGIPRGRTVLISGSCGTGKSIFAAHFVNKGFELGENSVYLTFEEGKHKLVEDLKTMGIDFEMMEKAGKLKVIGGPIGNVRFFKNKAKATARDIAGEIKEVVLESNAKRIVIDSLNLFLMLFDTDSERRHAMAELTSVLEKLNCTTVMTCEVKEGKRDISWYGFEEFVVDGVICLYRMPFENMFERAVSIIKMRGRNHSQNVVAMQIRDDGLHVFPTKAPFHEILR